MSEKQHKKKVKTAIAAVLAGGAIFFVLLVQREAIVESVLKSHLRDRGFEDVVLRVGTVHLTYLEVESISFKHGEQKFSAGYLSLTYTIPELWLHGRLREVYSRNLHMAISLSFEAEEWQDLPDEDEIVFPRELPFDRLELADSHLSLSLGEATHDIFFSMTVERVADEPGRALASGEGRLPGLGASFSFRQDVRLDNQDAPSVSGTVEVPAFYLNSKDFGPEWANLPSGYHFEGWVSAEGESSWSAGEGDMAGAVTITDLSLSDQAGDFEVRGISSVLTFASLKNFRTFPKQELSFSLLRSDGLRLENGTVVFEVEDSEYLDVQSVYFEWGGGIVAAAPFAFRWSSPEFILTVDMENIELAQILELIPDFPARGEGRLEGRLSVHIQPEGFDLRPGNLQLMEGTRGRLQIDHPGLLTQGMSSDHPDFERRRMTESALRNVEFSRFSVTLFPEGEPGTALILEFIAEPVEERRIKEVPVSLYLHADLHQLLRIGTQGRIRVE